MYEVNGKTVRTWNPFVGCNHDCVYCYAKGIAKRQKKRCQLCYEFVPHMHPERLTKRFKPGETVFVCSMGDIAFASRYNILSINEVIGNNPDTTFLIQTKNPSYFDTILHWEIPYPSNAVYGTTIETNRSTKEFSKSPQTYYRYKWLHFIDTTRKYVTIEPIMKFDMVMMVSWIRNIKPEFVYVGYNSRDSKNKHLPEPSLANTEVLISELEKITEVRRKLIRKAWWENDEA